MGLRGDIVAQAELLLYGVNVPEYPEFGDPHSVRREECCTRPGGLAPCRGYAEERAAVPPRKAHPGRSPSSALYDVLNRAGEAGEGGVDQPQVGDESVRPSLLGSKGATEPEVGIKKLAGDRLVCPVPDLVVEALDKV